MVQFYALSSPIFFLTTAHLISPMFVTRSSWCCFLLTILTSSKCNLPNTKTHSTLNLWFKCSFMTPKALSSKLWWYYAYKNNFYVPERGHLDFIACTAKSQMYSSPCTDLSSFLNLKQWNQINCTTCNKMLIIFWHVTLQWTFFQMVPPN